LTSSELFRMNHPHPEAVRRTHKLIENDEFDQLIAEYPWKLGPERIPKSQIEFGKLPDDTRVYTLRQTNA
jgi:hypothetical protein